MTIKNKIKIPKLSLSDKIKGIKGAYKRLKNNGLTNKDSYTTLKEGIERQVCCTTCTDGYSCPYCGCVIKAKKLLSTENCPDLEKYPHLRKFPPKNYWSVTKEKTSVIIPARNEKYLNKTIENLLETATGEIEILVGMDGWDFDYEVIKDDRVRVFKEKEHIGRRSIHNKLAKEAIGKYLLKIDAHVIFDLGWDTKLKCVCEENTIVGPSVGIIDEDKWEPKEGRWAGFDMDENLKGTWRTESIEKKIEEVMACPGTGWMIQKDTFWKFGGNNLSLSKWSDEEAEWACNIWLTGGKVLIRTDVVCAHLFRDKFPYKIENDSDRTLKILRQLWWFKTRKNQTMTIKELVKKFSDRIS